MNKGVVDLWLPYFYHLAVQAAVKRELGLIDMILFFRNTIL